MDTIDLSAFFQTKSQANDFSERISLIIEKIYSTTFDLEKTVSDQFGIKKKDAFMSLLRQNGIDIKDNLALKTFCTAIKQNINNLPILSLTLSFEPKEKTLQKVSEWMVVNANKQVIFDITINRELLGGALIDFNGKHMDFSIRSKFDEILTKLLSPDVTMHEKPTKMALHQEAEHLSI